MKFVGIRAVEASVVLLLVGLVASTVITSMLPHNELKADAQRIIAFIERVRVLAVFENKAYGLILRGDKSVSAWQREQGEWLENRQIANILTSSIVSVDDLLTHEFEPNTEPQPNVVVFKDGNISPFRWKIFMPDDDEFLVLEADPTGRLSIITP